MSPRMPATRASQAAAASSSSSSTSSPYPRRAPGQPKSSRQQFSACGACRMRRVRCDLKDLASSTSDPHPSCSNCKERGLKCVDEFAQVKAVKLLRRGRRLQQVEAVYGKVADGHIPDPSSSPSASSPSLGLPPSIHPKTSSVIPALRPEFFSSPFFRRFTIQHPILDPIEFSARFYEFARGDPSALSTEGKLCAMLLVTWAASYGVDECGNEIHDNDKRRRERKEKLAIMVSEIIALVDVHGILRRPSWDGVRALLLLHPLTEDIQPYFDRLTMYETALSQVHSLCMETAHPSVQTGLPLYGDALVRARIFWYAYIYEGTKVALLSGRRLIFDTDDLVTFQETLPPSSRSSPASPFSAPRSPAVPTFPGGLTLSPPGHVSAAEDHSYAPMSYLVVSQLMSVPLRLADIGRRVHAVLTSTRAQRRGDVDRETLAYVWEELARCWDMLDVMKREGAVGVGGIDSGALCAEDVERFSCGWQMYIFECYCLIRDQLNERLRTAQGHPPAGSSPGYDPLQRLHAECRRQCRRLLPRVLDILRNHLVNPSGGLFAYDAAFMRGGCIYAGCMLAQGDMPTGDESDGVREHRLNVEEGVQLCLSVLAEMRWALAKGDENRHKIHTLWQSYRSQQRGGGRREHSAGAQAHHHQHQHVHVGGPFELHGTDGAVPGASSSSAYARVLPRPYDAVAASAHAYATHGTDRPPLPPLSLSFSPDHPAGDSGPSTAYTEDGSWPPYTPPQTTTTPPDSTRGSPPGHGGSAGSPPFHYLPPMQYKPDSGAGQPFYPDADPFGFSVGPAGVQVAGTAPVVAAMAAYPGPPPGSAGGHRLPGSAGGPGDGGYLDPAMIFTTAPPSLSGSEEDCQPFGAECNGFYQ